MAQLASARIYIQVQETGEVIFMDSFVSIDTNMQLDGGSSATVKLMNRDDQWYTYASKEIKKQTDLSQFLLQAYQSNLYKEVNAKRQNLINEALKSGDKGAWKDIYTMQQFLMFNLFCRIWIDFRGRKDLINLRVQDERKYTDKPDRWYAGFTGIITDINETYDQGKDKSILISCSDMMRFFETTLVTTKPGFDPQYNLSTDINVWMAAYFNTSFAKFVDGGSIVSFVTNLTNINFHRNDSLAPFPFSKFWSLPDLQSGQTDMPQSAVIKPEYNGITNRRALTGFGATPSKAGILKTSDRQTPDFEMTKSLQVLKEMKKSDIIKFISTDGVVNGKKVNLEYVEDPRSIRSSFQPDVFQNEVLGTNKGLDTYQGHTYSMDTMIANSSDSGAVNNPYQQLFSESFDWNSNRITALEILRAVAGVTGYHIYCDVKGNLVYQKCRYDDFPGSKPDSNYDLAEDSLCLPMIDELGTHIDPSKNELANQSAMRFHGRNYLLGDESLLSWNNKQNESVIQTIVTVPLAQQQGINPGDYLSGKEFVGLATASPDVTARFGIRAFQSQPMLTKGLNRSLSQLMAEGFIRKTNAQIDNTEFRLNMRPDLQIGRTIYFMERRKLYYITGIQNHLIWGGEHETIVQGGYGHNPFEPILDPWRIAFTGKVDTTSKQFIDDLRKRQVLNDFIGQTLDSKNAQ